MKTQYLTCIFRLRDPTGWKKRVLNQVMTGYGQAVREQLVWCQENLQELREKGRWFNPQKENDPGSYSDISIRPLLPKVENELFHSSLRDSITSDVASKVASFLSLEQEHLQDEDAQQPSYWGEALQPLPEWDGVLDRAQDPDLLIENWVLDLQRSQWQVKHDRKLGENIWFGRCKGARGVHLLWDHHQERLYALFYLTSRGQCPKVQGLEQLFDLGEGHLWSSSTTGAVLVPLQYDRCGWTVKKFILPCLEGRASPKSAHLYQRKGKWLLSMGFAFECPDPYDPADDQEIVAEILKGKGGFLLQYNGHLLIDQDMRDQAYTIRKDRYRLQKRGRDISYDQRERMFIEQREHMAANTLIAEAQEHRSRLIIKGGGWKVKGFIDLLSYKARLRGVPVKWVGREKEADE